MELTLSDDGAMDALDLAPGTDRAPGTQAARLVVTDHAPGLWHWVRERQDGGDGYGAREQRGTRGN
jgi:hypothetical protein